MSAGTGLARLNMTELQRLERPLPFEELVGLLPAKFRASLRRILGTGGLLPPKTFAAAVDALTARDPNLAARLARFSENRVRAIRGLTWKERENPRLFVPAHRERERSISARCDEPWSFA
jgi:anti-sigma factor RsiW